MVELRTYQKGILDNCVRFGLPSIQSPPWPPPIQVLRFLYSIVKLWLY